MDAVFGLGNIVLEGGRNGDDEGVSGYGFFDGLQVTGAKGGLNQGLEAGFVDVDFPVLQGVHNTVINIYADDFVAVGGEHGGGGEADVAEAENTDVFNG